jgi:hypothetical protein
MSRKLVVRRRLLGSSAAGFALAALPLGAGAHGYLLNMLFLVTEKRFVHWSGK